MQFCDFHPLTLIIYFASVIAFTMITMNPCILLLSFFGAFFSVIKINKKSDIRFYIIIFVAISLTNPIFSHNGETVLFYLFEQRVTLEALFYGIAAGFLVLSVIYWFKLFGAVFTEDKLSWILGKTNPKLSVVFCMALRFVPLFKENAENILNTQISMGLFDTSKFKGKLSLAKNVFSALVSLSIENAIETADTMRSRGFENGKKSSYSLVLFSKNDLFAIITILICDILIAFCLADGANKFYYYPKLIWVNSNFKSYVIFAVLYFMPVINELKEDIKWRYLISKI